MLNGNGGKRLIGRVGFGAIENVDNGHALHDVAKHDVLVVEVRRAVGRSDNVKLRAVGIGTRIRHGERASLGVLVHKALVVKATAIDRLATSAVTLGEIAALNHEIANDSMKFATLEVQRHAGHFRVATLAGAKRTKIFHCFRNIIGIQFKHNSTHCVLCEEKRQKKKYKKKGARECELTMFFFFFFPFHLLFSFT